MEEVVHTAERLAELQALPLNRKIQISQTRIIEWYQHFNGNVVVSFSGGKDSTVLLHLVRSIYPDVPAVFSNTGLEYPELQKHVKTFDNVDIIAPDMRFDQVISVYGYPLISKEVAEAIYYARKVPDTVDDKAPWLETTGKRGRKASGANQKRREMMGEGKAVFNKSKWLPMAQELPFRISHYCCYKMKKSPMKKYRHKRKLAPFVATLAEESRLRKTAWIRHGCNAFDSADPMSQPMSFWTEQDVLAYIAEYNLPIASVYGNIVSVDEEGNETPPMDADGNIKCNLKCTGCNRTGCVFCGFGLQYDEGETRFQRLAKTHPKQYEFSVGGGQWVDNPDYDPALPEYDNGWKNWNPKQIWVPSKEGLGLGKVFDMANEIYGKDFYRYA